MKMVTPQLPYAFSALEPTISRSALAFHFTRHHVPCYERTLARVKGTDLQNHSLSAIVRASSFRGNRPLCQDAAAAWNHDFFWKSMRAGGGGPARGLMAEVIERTYGKFDVFASGFKQAAASRQGRGWLWVTWYAGQVHLIATRDNDTPILRRHVPLLALDLWEHAYFVDFQNQKDNYTEMFLARLANWEFAEAQLRRRIDAATAALTLVRAGVEVAQLPTPLN